MRSVRSIIVGVTAAGLLGLPVVAAASTSTPSASAGGSTAAVATAKARYVTHVRFLNFDHTRGYGTRTVVRGQIVYKPRDVTGSIPGGKKVRLYRKLDGHSSWNLVAKDYTGKDNGIFRIGVRSKANADYLVKYAGNATFKGSRGTTSVSVYRHFDARLEDGTGRFHGKVSPAYSHKTINLQKRKCADCGWSQVRSAKTARHGKYSFKVGAPKHGRWWWRVSTPASTAFITSYSSVYTTTRG